MTIFISTAMEFYTNGGLTKAMAYEIVKRQYNIAYTNRLGRNDYLTSERVVCSVAKKLLKRGIQFRNVNIIRSEVPAIYKIEVQF